MSHSVAAFRYVAAVAEHGSFSAAARAEGVSQPTISNAIADLEESCGARIFERSTRRVVLTPAGTRLLPLVKSVLEAMGDFDRAAHALRSPPHKMLRIGFSSLLGAQRLARLFGPFVADDPSIEIVYKECTIGDMEERLDAGTLDVVCGVNVLPGRFRARQKLYGEELRWVAPNAAKGPARVGLRDIADQRLLLTVGSCGLAGATRGLFARAKLPVTEYAGHALSYTALEEWAELGIGGALIPSSHIRRAPSAALVVDGKPARLEYEAVWRKDLLVARHANAFVKYLRTVVPRLAKGGALS